MTLQDAIHQQRIYDDCQAYKKALHDIAALPLGGNRTTKGDIDNYEAAVTAARSVLMERNKTT